MAKALVNEAFNIPEIESQGAKVISILDKIEEKIKTVNDLGGTAKGASEAAKAANEMFKQATDNLNNYTAVMKKQQAEINQLRKLDIAGSKEAIAISKEVERQQKQEAKINSELSNSYKQLELSAKATTDRYNNLAASLGRTHPLTVEAAKDAHTLNTELRLIDAGANKFGRAVGDYKTSFDGMGRSIQGLLREIPSVRSLDQLFLAWSNQWGILADEISKTRKEIGLLKAKGEDTPSLFNKIASSFLNWQTLMVVGIAIVSKYGAQFIETIGDLISSSTNAAKAQEILNKTYEDSAVVEATTNIQKLGVDIELAKNKTIDKERVLQEYNNTVGKVAGEVKNWNDLEQAYIDNSDKYVKFTLLRAASNYAFEESAKKGVQALLETQKTIENAANISPTNGNPVAMLKTLFSGVSAQNAKKESDSLLKIAEDFRRQAAAIYDVNDPVITKKTREKRVKEIKQMGEDTVDIYTQITNQLNDFEQDEVEIRNRSLAYLRSQLEAGVISVSQYEKQKQEIIKNSEKDMLEEQIKFLAQTLNNYGFSQENTTKIIELWQEKRIDLMKKETEAEEAELKEREHHRKRFDDINEKNQKESAQREKVLAREKSKYIQAIAEELAQFAFTLMDAQAEKEIKELEDSQDRTAQEYDFKREAIDQSSLAEDEKAARKKVLDAEEIESQKQIDAQIKDIKRKQAIFDKAQALATIAINTAVAVSSPANLALFGALTPLIVGLGAVQAAIVLATPIPEFAKGKKKSDSYEGLGIFGEAGTELLIDKSGKMQVASEPTLIYTRAGDEIISNKDLKKMMNPSQDGMVNQISYDELIKANAAQMDGQTKKVVRALGRVEQVTRNLDLNASVRLEIMRQRAS